MTIIKLIKMQLNVAYGLSVLRWYWSHNRTKFLMNVGLFLLILVSLGPIFYLYWRILDGLYLGAAMFGQGQVVITTGVVAGSLIVFFFGFAYIMSTLYFSRDLNFLLALPLKPSAVMAAKFSVVLLSNYITIIPLVLPALLVYGSYNGFTLSFGIISLVIFLLVPFLPLALSTILVMLLMRFTNLSQRRDAIRMAGMIFVLVLILGLNIFLTQIPEGMEAEFIQNILQENEGLVSYIGRTFPPAILATRALVNHGFSSLINLIYYMGSSAAAVFLAVMIGDRVFYQGLIGGSEVTARKSVSSEVLNQRLSRARHPAVAIASREIKYLLRTPIYFFNSVAVVILLPAVMIIPLIVGGGLSEIQQVLAMLDSRLLLILAAAAVMAGTAMFAPASSSSFSREGKTFWISKVIPVAPGVQIMGKILYSVLISLLAVPLVIILAIFLVPMSLQELLLSLGLGFILTIPVITISLLIDFIRPYLTWDDPQRAIKQNMNVLFGMIAASILLYGIYLGVQMAIRWGWGDRTIILAVAAAGLILGAIPYVVMLRIAADQFSRIEI